MTTIQTENESNKQKQQPEVLFKTSLKQKISQNSQKNICARASFLIKLQAFTPWKRQKTLIS